MLFPAALLLVLAGASAPLPAAESTASVPAGLNVLALGDSVTAGSGCDCTAFPARYGAGLAERYHRTVTVITHGENGATSADLLTELQDSAALRAQVAVADVVVITIGANDFADQHDTVVSEQCGGSDPLSCTDTELADLRDTLTGVLAQVGRLRDQQPTAVLLTGYWNVFEDGQQADRAYGVAARASTRGLTAVVNGTEEQVARAQGATYVDLAGPFLDGDGDPTALLATDGDHPDARGHQVIADALLAAGIAPLPA